MKKRKSEVVVKTQRMTVTNHWTEDTLRQVAPAHVADKITVEPGVINFGDGVVWTHDGITYRPPEPSVFERLDACSKEAQ